MYLTNIFGKQVEILRGINTSFVPTVSFSLSSLRYYSTPDQLLGAKKNDKKNVKKNDMSYA